MEFDLFNAMALLKKEFGNDAELTLRNVLGGVSVRISLFYKNKTYYDQFVISDHEILYSDYAHSANILFNKIKKELKNKYTEIK